MPRFRVTDYIRTPPSRSAIGALSGCAEWTRLVAAPMPARSSPPRWCCPALSPSLLRDGELLTAKQREFGAMLREQVADVAVAEVDVEEVDARGLGSANVDAVPQACRSHQMRRLLLRRRPARPVSRPSTRSSPVIARCQQISAASIIAKVHRDTLMTRMHDERLPFNSASNKGYGAPRASCGNPRSPAPRAPAGIPRVRPADGAGPDRNHRCDGRSRSRLWEPS